MKKIIVIGAMWCPACIKMRPMWEDIDFEKSHIEIQRLDLDYDEAECEKYRPGEILPVIIFQKDNEEVSRLIGEKNLDDIINEIGRVF